MTNPKPSEPTSMPAARECAVYILSQMAFKYVHPDHTIYAGRKEQDVIDRQIEMATERIEQYCASQLAAIAKALAIEHTEDGWFVGFEDKPDGFDTLTEACQALYDDADAVQKERDRLQAELQRVSGERDEIKKCFAAWKSEELIPRLELIEAKESAERQVAELREAIRDLMPFVWEDNLFKETESEYEIVIVRLKNLSEGKDNG